MTRDEAIAEAKHRQASDPDANWIAASRDGEWTVVRIVKPELSHLRPAKKPIGAFEGEQSQRALGHVGRDPTRCGVSV